MSAKKKTQKNYPDRYLDVKHALNALVHDTSVDLRTTINALHDIAQALEDLADELEENQQDPRINAAIQL